MPEPETLLWPSEKITVKEALQRWPISSKHHTGETMSPEQANEILAILDLANENGKFAIAVGLDIGPGPQIILERGMDKDWFRLIDVTPIDAAPGQLCRVFKLTPTGEMQRNIARDALK